MDVFRQDDSRGNRFWKETRSETISCYTKFVGQQGLLGEGGPLKLRYLRYLLRYLSKAEQTPKDKYFSCK